MKRTDSLPFVFATTLIVCLAQSPHVSSAQESQLIGDQQLDQVLEKLRTRNTEVRHRIVTRRVIEYQRRYCRCGLFGRRVCVRLVPVEGIRQERVADVIEHIEKGIGWDDPSDPRLGFAERSFSIAMLPQVAGARGSRINTVALNYLPLEIDAQPGDQDRSAVTTSTAFSSDPRVVPRGKEQIYRLLAKVTGAKDETVLMTVMVQQRDAATGLFENNKPTLNAVADKVWNSIRADLVK